MISVGAGLLVLGSLVFFTGAAIGVPGVFMVSDAASRLKMIDERMAYWLAAQPLYSVGPVLAAIGLLLLAGGSSGPALVLFVSGGSTMLAGTVAWSYDCYLRGVRPAEFAYGRLPSWPFTVYVVATIAGIALLAGALLDAGYSPWLYAMAGVADAFFLAFYVLTSDIPPFFFYTLFMVVGIVLAIDPGP